jgi:Holliday junction resolvase RusA-like endonuclease
MTVILTLPLPPSVNGLWANGKNLRRFRTQNYEDWIHEAGWALKQQRPAKLMGPVSIAYEFEEPKTKRKMDLANREKAATDLLVSHAVIEGDDQTIVRRMSLAWSESVSGVRITIEPLSGD